MSDVNSGFGCLFHFRHLSLDGADPFNRCTICIIILERPNFNEKFNDNVTKPININLKLG